MVIIQSNARKFCTRKKRFAIMKRPRKPVEAGAKKTYKENRRKRYLIETRNTIKFKNLSIFFEKERNLKF